MTKNFCDRCGEETKADPHGTWEIELRFKWSGTDKKTLSFCGPCGRHAAQVLGFGYDTGCILSLARGEYIGSGPHGGGAQRPDEPIAGAMK